MKPVYYVYLTIKDREVHIQYEQDGKDHSIEITSLAHYARWMNENTHAVVAAGRSIDDITVMCSSSIHHPADNNASEMASVICEWLNNPEREEEESADAV